MIFLYFLYTLCLVSYQINECTKQSDIVNFDYVVEKGNKKFYVANKETTYKSIPLTQQIQKLLEMEELYIKDKNTEYYMKPFKHFRIVNSGEIQFTGKFYRLGLDDNAVVCYYRSKKDKAKVQCILNDENAKIERFFSKDSSLLVYKIFGNFLGEKYESRIISYLSDNTKSEL